MFQAKDSNLASGIQSPVSYQLNEPGLSDGGGRGHPNPCHPCAPMRNRTSPTSFAGMSLIHEL